MHIIHAVPTNIITGFLGVGKTTAINHLLTAKPKNERWAVLVNEFGEIGVDGSLLGAGGASQEGIFIKEVAGGCMCCTSGLPMQVALNQLLSLAKPQRLLIEPTGLGHPAEVLHTLSQPHYQSVLNLQATMTLVDARQLYDNRYTSNDTFNEQLAVADVIVGNKTDLYQPQDCEVLINYCKTMTNASVHFVEYAQLNWQWLQQKNAFIQKSTPKTATQNLFDHHAKTTQDLTLNFSEQALPECGYVKVTNKQNKSKQNKSKQGEGKDEVMFCSVGWRFSPVFDFDRTQVSVFMMGLAVERAKAVFITTEGVFGYNKTPQGMTEIPLDDCLDSRIEIIHQQISDSQEAEWQNALLAAVSSNS